MDDPVQLLKTWLDEGRAAVPHQDTMTLATATPDGRPSARVVLLRGVDERGITFFTNRDVAEGRRAAPQPPCRRGRPLVGARPAGANRRLRRRNEQRGVARLLADAAARKPARSVGVTSIATAEQSGRARRTRQPRWRGASPATTCRCPRSGAATGSSRPASSSGLHREDRLHDRVRYVREPDGWRAERLAP